MEEGPYQLRLGLLALLEDQTFVQYFNEFILELVRNYILILIKDMIWSKRCYIVNMKSINIIWTDYLRKEL